VTAWRCRLTNDAAEPIPKDEAAKLCSEIRKEKGVRLFSQCWGCMRFSKGDQAKMCYSSKPDNRGCGLVNKRYENLFKA
jgi:uncharacterized protein (DUF779 family)